MLLNCPRKANNLLLNCNSYGIAGVHCIGQAHAPIHALNLLQLFLIIGSCTHGLIRLTGSSNHFVGEVEICIRGIWSTICGNGWDDNDVAVVCTQLGLSPFGL